jgi:hypothetical protein
MVFFDLLAADESDIPPVEAIVAAAVLFRIDVMASATASARWPTIGVEPLSDEEDGRGELFFKHDPITGKLSLYREDRATRETFSRPATFEECENLERAAVWSANHVEDRLRDHFAGQPNPWFESLRPKRPQ